ncbi:MAG: hypothetical protein [Xiangshan rhabdo-like virus 3]|uniref:Nucleoprotein n=1 Tax=Xiangshan rhabdo-like virus 3 TaxID=2886226 RepID=A0A8K1YQP9_9RHAB|nr:MAG: hypothetical protein [Xiangshan rhabdo-like virus 3]
MAISQLEAHLQNKLLSIEGTTKDIIKPTAPRLEGWNDGVLHQLRADISFPPTVYNRALLPTILRRFYRFYLTGIIPENDTIQATVYDVVALAETDRAPIWRANDNVEAGFYPPNESECADLYQLAMGAIPELVYLNENWTQNQREEYQALMAQYEQASSLRFRDHVEATIMEIDVNRGASKAEKELVRLSGFLAMTLLRFATKNVTQMGNAFLKRQYGANLSAIAGWPAGRAFSPPCVTCLDVCERGLQKGQYHTSKIFIMLAYEFTIASLPGYANPSALGYICASVLTHTARNGLGMIQMLEAVTLITRKNWQTLLDMTYCSATSRSWDYIMDFFSSQQKLDNLQYSFNWARIIEHGYFRGLSPKENVFLATLFASVIEVIQGPGVWNANWALGLAGIDNDAKLMGRELYHMCSENLETIEDTAGSKALIDRSKARKTVEHRENGVVDNIDDGDWN